MLDLPIAALAPDAVFRGRYRVVRAIKAGGMGAVYEVVDAVTNARRALKVMLPSVVGHPEMRARFTLEARITGDIESDHIVRVSDAGVDEESGTPFLVMDLLRGEDLRTILMQRGGLPRAEAVGYLSQVAMALDKTHAAGIVHRDLKPDNLFVTRRDDGAPCVKVLDFGVAKVIQQSGAQDSTRPVGTPFYMSPEQIRGKGDIGPAADLYALGHIAYALLTGEPYWAEARTDRTSVMEMFQMIVAGPQEAPSARARRRAVMAPCDPPLVGDLPVAFNAWFARATALAPEDRFGRASEAVAALAEALGVAPPTTAAPRSEQGVRSRAIAAAVTMASTPTPPDAPRGWLTGRTSAPGASGASGATTASGASGGTGKAMVRDRPVEVARGSSHLGWMAVIGAVMLLAGLTAALLLGRGGASGPGVPDPAPAPAAGGAVDAGAVDAGAVGAPGSTNGR